MNATLAKWKQRQMISRSVIHEAIRKANAVTRAHIARREEKAKRRKRKHMEGSTSDNKNNSNSTIFTTTSTTAVLHVSNRSRARRYWGILHVGSLPTCKSLRAVD